MIPGRRGLLYGFIITALAVMMLDCSAAEGAVSRSAKPAQRAKVITNTSRVPRYLKTKEQCQGYDPCLQDYYQRRRCAKLAEGSIPQNKCYVVYAARFYGQDPARAQRTAYCESKWDEQVVSPNGQYHNLFQFDWQTWGQSPFGRPLKLVNAFIARAGKKVKHVTVYRFNIFSAKYAALAAMSFWKKKQFSRWPRCAYT